MQAEKKIKNRLSLKQGKKKLLNITKKDLSTLKQDISIVLAQTHKKIRENMEKIVRFKELQLHLESQDHILDRSKKKKKT